MRRLLVFTLVATLAGCGDARDTRSPGEVHAAWVEALRVNDRQAAQALVATDAGLDVDRALEQAQYLVTHGEGGAGRLVAVDVEAPVAQGAGQVARSIWRLERLNSCFRATLAEMPAGWRVTGWEERQTDCPAAGLRGEIQP